MDPYVLLAIGVVILLVIIFFLTYVLNKKTPVPKGCENLKITDENCSACNNTSCQIKNGLDLQKLEKEIKEDN